MREQRDEGERPHSYSSKRRKQEKSKRGNPPRNPSTKDLNETPIQPDDPDEMFLLSLLPVQASDNQQGPAESTAVDHNS